MRRITPDRPWPLHGNAGSRALEARTAAALPPNALMQRAGLSVARLALALAPHAQRFWLACGPGNNGGDGLEAALHLARWGKQPLVSWLGDAGRLPPDAQAALQRVRAAGIALADAPPGAHDFAIDALLGLGSARPLEGRMAEWAERMNSGGTPVLAVDLPSGLSADTGRGGGVRATHTLSLLTLKPGLFTGGGRDAAGEIWFDDLGADLAAEPPAARLIPQPGVMARPHDSHKGRFGDVAVVGGAPGMGGAALLAASAALHAGAGRVFCALLGEPMPLVPGQPELMLRDWASLDLAAMAVACGCGGGDAVRAVLPRVLSTARALVLDADALNAVAADAALHPLLAARPARGWSTVLTPHPLEAARLLGAATQAVQADRLASAQALADRFRCVAVLKGSGTVVAAPGQVPWINPTGTAALATGGTGDVLAGLLAARLAAGQDAFEAAGQGVFLHGAAADRWPVGHSLTAGALAKALSPRASDQAGIRQGC
ncbi:MULTISPECIES: NAD(P)H-hydrate dehydratase [Ramlibacter]|uniref:Bifunctional NAD(P)H-hydrate repair enzyme n=1 Tax=Ramlibacter aquaticus TaxID=2780094 RepID=A0ABR9SDU4_9BURK|nr:MULTISPECIES: NAD(P)H-hydrate dehydratase [Ramlibacter]MBE7940488.1 NAD(P)H-hydrate dehydratase [Ramlibacter aquaticus]